MQIKRQLIIISLTILLSFSFIKNQSQSNIHNILYTIKTIGSLRVKKKHSTFYSQTIFKRIIQHYQEKFYAKK